MSWSDDDSAGSGSSEIIRHITSRSLLPTPSSSVAALPLATAASTYSSSSAPVVVPSTRGAILALSSPRRRLRRWHEIEGLSFDFNSRIQINIDNSLKAELGKRKEMQTMQTKIIESQRIKMAAMELEAKHIVEKSERLRSQLDFTFSPAMRLENRRSKKEAQKYKRHIHLADREAYDKWNEKERLSWDNPSAKDRALVKIYGDSSLWGRAATLRREEALEALRRSRVVSEPSRPSLDVLRAEAEVQKINLLVKSEVQCALVHRYNTGQVNLLLDRTRAALILQRAVRKFQKRKWQRKFRVLDPVIKQLVASELEVERKIIDKTIEKTKSASILAHADSSHAARIRTISQTTCDVGRRRSSSAELMQGLMTLPSSTMAQYSSQSPELVMHSPASAFEDEVAILSTATGHRRASIDMWNSGVDFAALSANEYKRKGERDKDDSSMESKLRRQHHQQLVSEAVEDALKMRDQVVRRRESARKEVLDAHHKFDKIVERREKAAVAELEAVASDLSPINKQHLSAATLKIGHRGSISGLHHLLPRPMSAGVIGETDRRHLHHAGLITVEEGRESRRPSIVQQSLRPQTAQPSHGRVSVLKPYDATGLLGRMTDTVRPVLAVVESSILSAKTSKSGGSTAGRPSTASAATSSRGGGGFGGSEPSEMIPSQRTARPSTADVAKRKLYERHMGPRTMNKSEKRTAEKAAESAITQLRNTSQTIKSKMFRERERSEVANKMLISAHQKNLGQL